MSVIDRIKEYRNTDAINKSLLVALSKGIGGYKKEKEKYYEEKSHFDLGDAFDIMISAPEEFNNVFYVHDELAAKPGKGSLSVVRSAYDAAVTTFDDLPMELSDKRLKNVILNACFHDGYGGNDWSDARRIRDIVKKGSDYYTALLESRGRSILSTKQKELVDALLDKVYAHPFTAWVFDVKGLPGMEFVTQQPVYTEYRGHKVKCLPDIVIFNNNDCVVMVSGISFPARSITPIDTKTTGNSVKGFTRASKDFRYDVQGAYYSWLLQLANPEYKVLPFLFLVVSTTTNEHPLIYRMTKKDMDIARWGGIYRNNGEFYGVYPIREEDRLYAAPDKVDVLGFEQMLDLYEWHLEYNEWEYDKKIIENNGTIELNQWY